MYVYLTGRSVLDLLAILLIVPQWLRNMNLLSPSLAFSHKMAQYESLRPTLQVMVNHSLLWIMTLTLLVRYLTLINHEHRSCWTKISSSRIVVFLVVLMCAVINFAGFFEIRPVEYLEHCFKDMQIFGTTPTDFASSDLMISVYPWITVAFCFALPYAMLVICFLLLACKLQLRHLWRQRQELLDRAGSHDETVLSFIVIIISIVFITCDFPFAVLSVLHTLTNTMYKALPGMTYALYAAEILSFLPCAVTWLTFLLLSPDYRRTLGRVFCCLWLCGDEYYEPVKCSLSCCKPQKKKSPGITWV